MMDNAPNGITEIDQTLEIDKHLPKIECEPDPTLIGFSQVFNPDLEVDLFGNQNAGFPLLMMQQNPSSGTMAAKNDSIMTKPAAIANDTNSLLVAMLSKVVTFVDFTFNFGQ